MRARDATKRKPPVYASVEDATAVRVKAGEFERPEAMSPVVERNLLPTAGGFTWRSDPRLKLPAPTRFTKEQVAAFLRQIACPVLLIRAVPGMAFSGALREVISNNVKKLTYREVTGFHHVHLEWPERVVPHLDEFLTKVGVKKE